MDAINEHGQQIEVEKVTGGLEKRFESPLGPECEKHHPAHLGQEVTYNCLKRFFWVRNDCTVVI